MSNLDGFDQGIRDVRLANGVMMPILGFGTWQINDKDLMSELIYAAVEQGYKLIDTAAAYSNERIIGRAIREHNILRDKLFLTDKVWNTSRGHDAVIEACKKSLKKLKTDYLDLYLIHWPASPKLHSDWREINADTWSGMEDLYREGVVRAIGVCNFKAHHLKELEKMVEILPMVDQIEFHPGMAQAEILEYCLYRGIQVEASSPLGNGQILQNEDLKEIALQYHKTPAQICLRWAIQKCIVVIPKSVRKERLGENAAVFDFELSDEEMRRIDNISYCGGIGLDPDEVTDFG